MSFNEYSPAIIKTSLLLALCTVSGASCLFGNRIACAKASNTKASHHGGKKKSASGTATIYSNKFNGRKTATGEKFHQDKLTAASPHLPLGSKVKVTNEKTGKSVTVKINDKQPAGGNRVVDLSKAAANKLGIKGKGDVKATVVGK